ncbi:MAG TPA: tyrosine-protein phosphatase [Candidatus Dormibacteraeota bacterium]|nr:tyrosine-protein phosphatase [Candidatus Dormibacteraeota bacterium]
MAARRLDWPDCRNTRDLGGLPTRHGLTRPGVAVRSDNVASLTPAGRQSMIDYGITTVIDLRSESEVKGAPGPPFSEFQSTSALSPLDGTPDGPVFLHLPLIDDATAPILNQAPTMPERYALMLDHRQEALAAILDGIASADGPVLFHCFAGKDRTGLVAAVLLSVAGVDPDAIGADYAETDIQLASRYEEWLAKASPERLATMRDELRCPPEWILSTLDHLERKWGGVEAYLEAGGLSADIITRLQSKLTS